jgi:hypothetical protein
VAHRVLGKTARKKGVKMGEDSNTQSEPVPIQDNKDSDKNKESPKADPKKTDSGEVPNQDTPAPKHAESQSEGGNVPPELKEVTPPRENRGD